MKYIKNDKNLGIEYDFNLLKRKYKKLNCPNDVYTPLHVPFDRAKWIVDLSDRSTGKTTGWLLLGLLMFREYGTVIQYVRQRADFIAPKISGELFKAILQHGYIEKITDGEYNSVCYRSKRWFLCNRKENGEIENAMEQHFCYMLSVDKSEEYKSGYNAPTGDIIIYDEFIGKYYTQNEFVYFCDLVKTIQRERISPFIVLLANTINKESPYFNELEIYDAVQKMKIGDSDLITTERGTSIYVELLGIVMKKKEKRSVLNRLFYGFQNNALGAITGEDWAVKNYQHIPDGNAQIINSQYYILFNKKYVRLDIVNHETLGRCIYCHWATRNYDDSIIFTIENQTDTRYRFRTGGTAYSKLWNMYKMNKFYYSTNDVGHFIEQYLNMCAQYRF